MTVQGTNEVPTAESGKGLIDLLTAQLELYVQLNQLAQSQRKLITGDEPGRLIAVLSERQQLLDRLESVASRLKPYQLNWHDVRQRMTDTQGATVDRLVNEINTILGDILRRDEADGELLSARKSSIAGAMSSVRTARQVGAAYAEAAGGARSSTEWTHA